MSAPAVPAQVHSLSLSLSLYIYIYIYIYLHVFMCVLAKCFILFMMRVVWDWFQFHCALFNGGSNTSVIIFVHLLLVCNISNHKHMNAIYIYIYILSFDVKLFVTFGF